jgi:hypothetical protein
MSAYTLISRGLNSETHVLEQFAARIPKEYYPQLPKLATEILALSTSEKKISAITKTFLESIEAMQFLEKPAIKPEAISLSQAIFSRSKPLSSLSNKPSKLTQEEEKNEILETLLHTVNAACETFEEQQLDLVRSFELNKQSMEQPDALIALLDELMNPQWLRPFFPKRYECLAQLKNYLGSSADSSAPIPDNVKQSFEENSEDRLLQYMGMQLGLLEVKAEEIKPAPEDDALSIDLSVVSNNSGSQPQNDCIDYLDRLLTAIAEAKSPQTILNDCFHKKAVGY